jgi:cyclohexyl-isocyanide hydratase
MQIAFLIFDGITWLDLIGVYDPVSRLRRTEYLPGLTWDICSLKPGAKDMHGLEVQATRVGLSLQGYDVLIVPGGQGTRDLMHDRIFLDWLQTAKNARYKISICTGSLLLGAAGFLKGKAATTHFAEYETLQPFCREVLRQRIVDDDGVITAGAVSSSIDLGLYLCYKWVGSDCESDIRRKLDYRGAHWSVPYPTIQT